MKFLMKFLILCLVILTVSGTCPTGSAGEKSRRRYGSCTRRRYYRFDTPSDEHVTTEKCQETERTYDWCGYRKSGGQISFQPSGGIRISKMKKGENILMKGNVMSGMRWYCDNTKEWVKMGENHNVLYVEYHPDGKIYWIAKNCKLPDPFSDPDEYHPYGPMKGHWQKYLLISEAEHVVEVTNTFEKTSGTTKTTTEEKAFTQDLTTTAEYRSGTDTSGYSLSVELHVGTEQMYAFSDEVNAAIGRSHTHTCSGAIQWKRKDDMFQAALWRWVADRENLLTGETISQPTCKVIIRFDVTQEAKTSNKNNCANIPPKCAGEYCKDDQCMDCGGYIPLNNCANVVDEDGNTYADCMEWKDEGDELKTECRTEKCIIERAQYLHGDKKECQMVYGDICHDCSSQTITLITEAGIDNNQGESHAIQLKDKSKTSHKNFNAPKSSVKWSGIHPTCGTDGSLSSSMAWCARSNTNGDYVFIDLGSVQSIYGVRTAGRHNLNQWVTKFTVSTSSSPQTWGKTWTTVGTFNGNKDRNTVVQNLFSHPVTARYVKFTPVTYHGFKSMRVDAIVGSGTEEEVAERNLHSEPEMLLQEEQELAEEFADLNEEDELDALVRLILAESE